ncbi:hypothetical protein AHAS_Ahas01G0109800 [Arachis hypogaea]
MCNMLENIVVHQFDRRNELFEVCEMPNEKASSVDLARRTVDYGHFQVERLPCHHIIGCCANQRLNWQVYVNDVYMMTDIRKVYNIDFVPLGDLQTCRSYSGLTLVAYLTLRRMSKGRPKLTRYLNEMDSRQIFVVPPSIFSPLTAPASSLIAPASQLTTPPSAETMELEKSTGGGLYVLGKDRVVYVPQERKSR